MRKTLHVSLIMLAIAFAVVSCDALPPTVVYVVVTPTPETAPTSAGAAETVQAGSTEDVESPAAPTPDMTLTSAANVQATAAAAITALTQVAAESQIAAQQTQNAGAIVATESSLATVSALATTNAAATSQAQGTLDAQAQAQGTLDAQAQQANAQATANAIASLTPPAPTNTPPVTPLPPGFPTPVTAEIQVAEQLFERGRMFWLQPTGEIWVLAVTSEGRGTWTIYQDEYVDGEVLSTVTAPAGMIVPERGFGKLWRESQTVQDALGFAVTPEFGYVSPYQYHAGGTAVSGQYTPGPGFHVLYSLYGEQFRFNEIDGTWQLGGA